MKIKAGGTLIFSDYSLVKNQICLSANCLEMFVRFYDWRVHSTKKFRLPLLISFIFLRSAENVISMIDESSDIALGNAINTFFVCTPSPFLTTNGQLSLEWIYELIVSPKSVSGSLSEGTVAIS